MIKNKLVVMIVLWSHLPSNATDISMHLAASSNDVKKIKRLIDTGADVNAIDKNGRTPLHFATLNKNIETVQLLIKFGANLQVTDHIGQTPLHIAANSRDYDYSKNNKDKLKFNDILVGYDYNMS